ncbi:MAG TPA: hypothetical protein PKE49_12860 [Leptospiraceae bacterium]|nr:hypothetical protein [Leptospirales bacterium]HMU84966.1 hypothetical protein [Leptospiraceae bacterium]HMW60887.1 hypothetical protein [Leptospiraceae bacterium]HMX57411.1 hypothetical protein [Leptospiraceae bacterium]HMY45219.1 hypothetical protein [Leptospiraceae bacterium]
MRTWFNNNEGELDLDSHAPADTELARKHAQHRSLDAGLKKALGSLHKDARHDASKFQKRLAAALADTKPELSFGEKISLDLDRFFSILRADSYAALRYATVLIIPFVGIVVYSFSQKTTPTETAAVVMESPSGSALHEEMAPDADLSPQAKDDALHKMGGAYPEQPVPRAAMIAADKEFEAVAQETLQIQEDLLKKNLEMAQNTAAKKSALDQLLDFYTKNGNHTAAKEIKKELTKLSAH